MTIRSQFLLFAMIGGFAALLNIVVRLLFNFVVPFEVAVVLAFPISLTIAFFLNRRFVFQDGRGGGLNQYARFWLVNLIALVQVLAVSVLLARSILPWIGFTWHAETVAHVIGVFSPVITSFVFHRNFTFGLTTSAQTVSRSVKRPP